MGGNELNFAPVSADGGVDLKRNAERIAKSHFFDDDTRQFVGVLAARLEQELVVDLQE